MCIYMYTCMIIHLYIYIYICLNTHTHTHMYVYIYMGRSLSPLAPAVLQLCMLVCFWCRTQGVLLHCVRPGPIRNSASVSKHPNPIKTQSFWPNGLGGPQPINPLSPSCWPNGLGWPKPINPIILANWTWE